MHFIVLHVLNKNERKNTHIREQLPRNFLLLTPSLVSIVCVVGLEWGAAAVVAGSGISGDNGGGGDGGGNHLGMMMITMVAVTLAWCTALLIRFLLPYVDFIFALLLLHKHVFKCSVYLLFMSFTLPFLSLAAAAAAERERERKKQYTHAWNQEECKCVMCAWFCNK